MPNVTPPNSPKFTLLRNTMIVKRAEIVGTRRGEPELISDNIRCSEVMPFDATAESEAMTVGLSADYQLFCDPTDVLRQDVVVISGMEFTVSEVAPWPVTNPRIIHLLVRRYQKP